MTDDITELSVFDSPGSDKNVFNAGVSYVIPLYQRAFAWEEKQITALIEDIESFNDSDAESSYYLGTLVVYKKKNEGEGGRILYEVIDGQQRLTALFLILSCLKKMPDMEDGKCLTLKNLRRCFVKKDKEKHQTFLTFECRERADDTLEMNFAGRGDDEENKELDEALLKGQKIIDDKFKCASKEKTDWFIKFVNKLPSVKLYRIEVPENTDLNRYFEIMNTRGEQLEQADILKARLMGYLQKGGWDKERHAFAKIWDACSDMTGYVQMHFEPVVRAKLFDKCWDDCDKLKDEWKAAFESDSPEADQNKENSLGSPAEPQEAKTIEYLITHPVKKVGNAKAKNSNEDPGDKVRFESIISFPYFLLHVLKVYLGELNESGKALDIDAKFPLDDQKLLDPFNEIDKSFDQSKNDESQEGAQKDSQNDAKAEFAEGFIGCLLKCRFLFDNYIVKRDHLNEDTVGSWSIKTLKTSDSGPDYSNTVFVPGDGDFHKRIVMLQSCLRVSITSPKVMHWITDLLKWLYQNCNKNRAELSLNFSGCKTTTYDLSQFEDVIENQIRYGTLDAGTDNAPSGRVTVNGYLEGGNYDLGTATPHLVFNYLDYLLWKKFKEKEDEDKDKPDKEKFNRWKIDYDKFAFEYRNSVEHWYPQNPPKDTISMWPREDGLDNFGNLCLVQRSSNSRYSNRSPVAKQEDFFNDNSHKNSSLKLRIMAAEIKKLRDDKSSGDANQQWRERGYKEHGEEMLAILKAACPAVPDPASGDPAEEQ